MKSSACGIFEYGEKVTFFFLRDMFYTPYHIFVMFCVSLRGTTSLSKLKCCKHTPVVPSLETFRNITGVPESPTSLHQLLWATAQLAVSLLP